MRWGTGSFTWVRPIRNILCLFDGDVLDFSLEGLRATNTTVGHRFLAPERFLVTGFADYIIALEKRHVLLDRTKRAEILRTQLQTITQHQDINVIQDKALFDEVLGLVEWPMALLGRIDAHYMDLPEELIITPMKVHQRYFPVRYKSGALAPFFVCVAGTQTADGGKTVLQGNEAVLKARLADARFFFDTDKKISLDKRVEELSLQVFHRRLGTIADRLPRLRTWGALLHAALTKESLFRSVLDRDLNRAFHLSKADLRTEVVKEFPELQGIMGGYYAALQGERASVADALKEHYRPQGLEDTVPSTPLGVLLSLADKLEIIWSFFSIQEHPTGSKDPFALRRAALGVIRILEAHRLSLDLGALLEAYVHALMPPTASSEETSNAIFAFFKERLKVYLRKKDIASDLAAALLHEEPRHEITRQLTEPKDVSCILILPQKSLNIWRILERAPVLSEFLKSAEGSDLLQGYRRIANILAASKKHEGESNDIHPDIFQSAAEKSLYQKLQETDEAMISLHKTNRETCEDFQKRLILLACLRAPINAFFEEVFINDKDESIRNNRLALLKRAKNYYDLICAFSHKEPKTHSRKEIHGITGSEHQGI
jgi:glycyl-tRNA synthetase beta chain